MYPYRNVQDDMVNNLRWHVEQLKFCLHDLHHLDQDGQNRDRNARRYVSLCTQPCDYDYTYSLPPWGANADPMNRVQYVRSCGLLTDQMLCILKLFLIVWILSNCHSCALWGVCGHDCFIIDVGYLIVNSNNQLIILRPVKLMIKLLPKLQLCD